MNEEQKLNLKADALEGKFYQCNDCDHSTEEQVKECFNPISSDFDKEGLPCGSKECNHIIEYNEILKKINNRTGALCDLKSKLKRI